MGKPTRESVLAFGLPSPAAAPVPLRIEQVDTASGRLFSWAHGLATDDAITLRLHRDTTPGAPAQSLPTGLQEGVTYYARPTSDDAFTLATAVSPAAAIASYASAGLGEFEVRLDPWAALDAAIERAWTAVLADCTAHGGEVEAAIITDAAAALSVRLYVAHVAAGDPGKGASFDALASLYAEVYAPKLAAYFRGVPVRGATDGTPGVSEGSPLYRVLGPAVATSAPWGTCGSEVV